MCSFCDSTTTSTAIIGIRGRTLVARICDDHITMARENPAAFLLEVTTTAPERFVRPLEN